MKRNRNSDLDDQFFKLGWDTTGEKHMDRKLILIPALAAGIFLAQSAQQGAQAMSVSTAVIGQTSSTMLTLADWGGHGGYGYGSGWGRHGYGGGWGRYGYGGGWGRHGYGGGWGRHGYGGGWGRHGYGGGWGRHGGRWG